MSDLDVGDWVRFYQAGYLQIGIIQYIGDPDYQGRRELKTDQGSIREDYILECRAKGDSDE